MVDDLRMRWQSTGRIAMRALLAAVIVAAVAAAVAYVVVQSLPKAYASEARVYVGSLTATSTDELDAFQRLAQTYAQLATSSSVLSRVVDRVGLSDSPAALAARTDVRAPGQGILLIDATAPTASEAAEIANAISAEILALATPPGQGASLAAVIQPAIPPTRPSSPNVLINTLVAAGLGFVLGLGLPIIAASWGARTGTRRIVGTVSAERP